VYFVDYFLQVINFMYHENLQLGSAFFLHLVNHEF